MANEGASVSVSARAPGKINICFRVGEQRDDGTRGVATLYQAVSIYDTVTVTNSQDFSVSQAGSIGFGRVSLSEKNLAFRAAKLMAKKFGVSGGVNLSIEKQIPRGAGMSGGSADAAAALLACNELWDLRLDRAEILALALELGADVPFSLEGGTAVGTGHGDEFSQALSTGKYHWVIVPVGPRLEEDRVLSVLDRHRTDHSAVLGDGGISPRVTPVALKALRSGSPDLLAEALHNDVQVASFKLSPELAAVCEFGEKNGALAGVMLAMGPGLAFLTPDAGTAISLKELLAARGHGALTARGPVGGAKLI